MKNFNRPVTGILSLLFVLIAGTSFSQSKISDWKELTAFHKVMSQTFHPSEEGNLEPIKTRIDEMVTAANTLKASVIPADYNNKNVKKAVGKLAKGSKALKKTIASGASDETIKADLAKLHDVFHEIVGLCSANDDHHHGEGNGEGKGNGQGHHHHEGEGHEHK